MAKKRLEQGLPDEYAKPMMDMLQRFTGTIVTPEIVVPSPIVIAIVIAIVIILWPSEVREALTDKDRAALKFAVEQIRAEPEKVRELTGIDVASIDERLEKLLEL